MNSDLLRDINNNSESVDLLRKKKEWNIFRSLFWVSLIIHLALRPFAGLFVFSLLGTGREAVPIILIGLVLLISLFVFISTIGIFTLKATKSKILAGLFFIVSWGLLSYVWKAPVLLLIYLIIYFVIKNNYYKLVNNRKTPLLDYVPGIIIMIVIISIMFFGPLFSGILSTQSAVKSITLQNLDFSACENKENVFLEEYSPERLRCFLLVFLEERNTANALYLRDAEDQFFMTGEDLCGSREDVYSRDACYANIITSNSSDRIVSEICNKFSDTHSWLKEDCFEYIENKK